MSMAKEKNQIKANLTRDSAEERCCPAGLKHSLEKHIEHQRKSVPADGRKGAHCPQKRVLLFKGGENLCMVFITVCLYLFCPGTGTEPIPGQEYQNKNADPLGGGEKIEAAPGCVIAQELQKEAGASI